MDRTQSPDMSQENEECAKIVALNAPQVEIEDRFLVNTQAVLEVESAPRKGKGKALISRKKQVQSVKKHGFFVWLETSWQAEITLRVVKPWMQAIQKSAMKEKDQRLYQVGQIISKIFKEFIIHLKSNETNLMDCYFVNFEEWCSGEGLSMISGKLPQMDWDDALSKQLFDHYSECVMALTQRQQEHDSDQESLSLVNTEAISMLSTTAHTRAPRAAASTSRDCEIISPKTPKRTITDVLVNGKPSLKGKLPFRKRKVSSDEEYSPGTLFEQAREIQRSVEDESEPDFHVQAHPIKKAKKTVRMAPVEDVSEESEEDYDSMVANLARAHTLGQGTGRISQSILVKDDDGYISITSPGERGCLVAKLEIYPFSDVSRLPKNQYWTKRNYSSLTVISSEDSPAYKTLMKLRTQLSYW